MSRRVPARRLRPVAALVAGALVVATALAGCTPTAGSIAPVPATAADAAWGQAPSPQPGVTMQPDVVIIGGGGGSVRAVTADGLTWTLDPAATHVGDLAVGKVMFLTARGVGRVIDLQHTSAGVVVTLGPVSITDVIRDGDFSTPTPISLGDQAIGQVADGAFFNDPAVLDAVGSDPIDIDPDSTPGETGTGDGPTTGKVTSGGPSSSPTPTPKGLGQPLIQGASWIDTKPPTPDQLQRGALQVGKVQDQLESKSGNFDLNRSWDAQGTGTSFTYENEGLRIVGKVALKTTSPKADFDLKINSAKITLAKFTLTGASSLHAELEASTTARPAVNAASRALGVGMDYHIPVGTILGIPFEVTVSNTLEVQIFLPGTADVKGSGDYDLGATLGFQYANGDFKNLSSGTFNADQAVKGASSLAVGISGFNVEDDLNFSIGIGFLGFHAGLDFGLRVLVVLSIGAPIGFNVKATQGDDPIERCRNARGVLQVNWGLGYTITGPIATVIDWFTRHFTGKPVAKSGGVHSFAIIAVKDVTEPQSGFCT
jgi:hypothetical protein